MAAAAPLLGAGIGPAGSWESERATEASAAAVLDWLVFDWLVFD
jgi:hypothetical protein